MSKNIAKYRNLLFRWKRARAIYGNIWRYLTIFDDIWRHRRSSFKPENCRPKVSSSVGTNKLKKKFFQLFQKEQDYRHFKKPVMSKLNIISAYCWLLLQRKSVKKGLFILRRQQVVYKHHQNISFTYKQEPNIIWKWFFCTEAYFEETLCLKINWRGPL